VVWIYFGIGLVLAILNKLLDAVGKKGRVFIQILILFLWPLVVIIEACKWLFSREKEVERNKVGD